MGPNELDTFCVPLIFDFEDIKNSCVYDQEGNYCFPKMLNLSYSYIHDKEILLVDLGQEFILFVQIK